MGNNPSKVPCESDDSNTKIDNTFDDIPESCDGDPRSPTIDINRTPLQTLGASKVSTITKNVDLSKKCFDKHEKYSLTSPRVRALMSSIDPRSPAMDFQRTPLQFMTKKPELIAASNQLNISDCFNDDGEFDNSKTGVIEDIQPKNLCNDLNNLSNEVLSETSTEQSVGEDIPTAESAQNITLDCEAQLSENTSSSTQVVGLLETNLDYLETNLDMVRKKYNNPLKLKTETFAVSNENTKDEVCSELVKKDLSEKDPRSPVVDINRTPILIVENREIAGEPPKPLFSENNKLNSHMQDLFKYNLKLQQKKGSFDNDLARKFTDSVLIFEDTFDNQKTVVTPKTNSNIQNNEGSRTPLSCKTHIDKTYSSSKPTTPLADMYNSDQTTLKKTNSAKLESSKSRIPIKIPIKSHLVSAGAENTPPPQPRKACWDKDNSVLL